LKNALRNDQKLVSENRAATSAGFATAMPANGTNSR
jgi:hypothetical protein